MEYVTFYTTDAKTGQVTETRHYLTSEEIAQYSEQQKQRNKAQAKQLLAESDWATRPSVADPALSNPYLANQSDFIAYQNALRQIVFNPPDTEIDFPATPQEVWATTGE
jgi:hypothetical protein